jgi:hypothetical protein
MGSIGQPNADGMNVFAGRDRGRMADERDEIAFATRLDPEDRKAVVGIVERDAFDASNERLAFRTGLAFGFAANEFVQAI